jgi:hypothetical protein
MAQEVERLARKEAMSLNPRPPKMGAGGVYTEKANGIVKFSLTFLE